MHRLRVYFYSGWAFMIPYLGLYLFYYVCKLPVNPGGAGFLISLLHLYWFVHAIHICLVVFFLWSWEKNPVSANSLRADFDELSLRSFRIIPMLPWLILAFLIYIPGSYFEWPSDTWMHYWRINAWAGIAEVGSHEFWFKSGYFFAYSLLGLVPVKWQLFWVNVYYAGTCLLLCWQYFRLARSVGLGARAAFLFVLLQAFLFGNSVFSFYRYYGLSTTIFSQIGVVALIRLVYEFARGAEARGHAPFPRSSWIAFVSSSFCLTLLVAFNHAQGLGLIALGICAVAAWRGLEWNRSFVWYGTAVALALSFAAIYWWPRHPAIDQAYRPSGMFTFWYGFNVFSFWSPAGDRMLDILGFTGLVNVAAGMILIVKRNHVAGWLTITPFLGLSLPFIAIPFAGILAGRFGHWNDVISYARMFLAIPAGLAMVCLGQELMVSKAAFFTNLRFPLSFVRVLRFPVVILALLALLALPTGSPWYNRFWNALAITPADLQLGHVTAGLAESDRRLFAGDPVPGLVTTPAMGYIGSILGIQPISPTGRVFWDPVVSNANILLSMTAKAVANHGNMIMLAPAPLRLYTSISFAGELSGHWLPQEVALDHAAGPELESVLRGLDLHQNQGPAGTYYILGSPAAK